MILFIIQHLVFKNPEREWCRVNQMGVGFKRESTDFISGGTETNDMFVL